MSTMQRPYGSRACASTGIAPPPTVWRMTLDHLVLTRFSAVRRGHVEPMPAEWLTYRLGFFYDACYPSLTRQVGGASFRWLVFLDDRCPDDFREQVLELAEGAFEPIWGHEDFHTTLLPRAVERCTTVSASGGTLVTTRVDSDDAVARDFVVSVQSRVKQWQSEQQLAGHDRFFVNFTRGLQVDRSGAVYRRDQPHGPFISLVEQCRHRRCAAHRAHDEAQPG